MRKNHALLPNATPPAPSVFSVERWGLPREAVQNLGRDLRAVWQRYHHCFVTRRHDTSFYAFIYLKGLMLLPNQRNYVNIARRVVDPESDGQNLQHFMSDSPWSAQAVFEHLQEDIRADHRLQGGMLSLDESGDVRAGDQSAGAAHQYIGNVGKVAMGQVGVALGYYAADTWTLVDAELFLPAKWFDQAHRKLHRKLHIPKERTYKTKLEIGLELIDRARQHRLPFSRFSCDALYGQSHEFRQALAQRQIPYLADIPSDLAVYLEAPVVGIPPKPEGAMGRPPSRWQVLSDAKPIAVRDIAQMPETKFETLDLRFCERGQLRYDCTARTVWTITSKGQVRCERLFMRRESDGEITYSLSNEPETTPLRTLALWRCERYFVERTFQDAKSEGGWDELVARKYRAWMHHTALDALTLWFVAQTKLNWAEKHPPDPDLAEQLQIEKLPSLSMANVRLLLEAVMPLPRLSENQAINLVVKHLVNRSASTRSRKKKQAKERKRKRRNLT